MWKWAYICPVGSNLIFLDVPEWSFEPYTLRGVLVIPEEELERSDGDPNFWVFHRESRFRASPETFWEDLSSERVRRIARGKEGRRETNRRTVVEQRLVWGGPNYVVVIIGNATHNGKAVIVESVKEVKEAKKGYGMRGGGRLARGGCKWWKVWGKKGARNQGDPNLAVIKAGGPWKCHCLVNLVRSNPRAVVRTLISEVQVPPRPGFPFQDWSVRRGEQFRRPPWGTGTQGVLECA